MKEVMTNLKYYLQTVVKIVNRSGIRYQVKAWLLQGK